MAGRRYFQLLALWIVLLVPAVGGQLLVQGQATAQDLATGKILVARRHMADLNFAQTVILLVQHDEKGTVGLIVNRPTKIPLSRLTKEFEGVKDRSDPLYLGGPMERSGVMALVRSRAKPEDAKAVFADVYMISVKETLEKAIAAATSSRLHLYLGYAGWAAGQLEWELGMDAWDVLPPNAGMVFDPHPETLWNRLVDRENLQNAAAPSRGGMTLTSLRAISISAQ
ncbi:MAG TPA: YqgE/AlgH family protein [Bryobacteraceae bacterium]|nr:YqgE/AlgH family protein [Bryobacteraceae bacterium]